MEPIKIKPNFTNKNSKYGKIEVKIKSINDFISSPNAPYESALLSARQMQAETFAFEYSVGNKKNAYLEADTIRTIISDAFQNQGVVSIARVRMTDENGTALYNLFENKVHNILQMQTDIKGEISFEDLYGEMRDNYIKM